MAQSVNWAAPVAFRAGFCFASTASNRVFLEAVHFSVEPLRSDSRAGARPKRRCTLLGSNSLPRLRVLGGSDKLHTGPAGRQKAQGLRDGVAPGTPCSSLGQPTTSANPVAKRHEHGGGNLIRPPKYLQTRINTDKPECTIRHVRTCLHRGSRPKHATSTASPAQTASVQTEAQGKAEGQIDSSR